MYSTLLGILFSSILCTCPNQCNLFNRITAGFLTLSYISVVWGRTSLNLFFFSLFHPTSCHNLSTTPRHIIFIPQSSLQTDINSNFYLHNSPFQISVGSLPLQDTRPIRQTIPTWLHGVTSLSRTSVIFISARTFFYSRLVHKIRPTAYICELQSNYFKFRKSLSLIFISSCLISTSDWISLTHTMIR
jgi:hypothetical protein